MLQKNDLLLPKVQYKVMCRLLPFRKVDQNAFFLLFLFLDS